MAMETATSGIQRSSSRWRNRPVDLHCIRASLDRYGFAIVPRLLDPSVVESLLTALRIDIDAEIHSTRDLLWTCPSIAALAACLEIRSLVVAVLGDKAIPVRGLLFDMRPLLLHASSAANVPSHRRVIHLEFAGAALPDGLAWRQRSA